MKLTIKLLDNTYIEIVLSFVLILATSGVELLRIVYGLNRLFQKAFNCWYHGIIL